MTPEEFQQIHELFDAARQLPTSDRAGFLDAKSKPGSPVRLKVDELLEQHERSDGVLADAALEPARELKDALFDSTGAATFADRDPPHTLPQRIGKYRIRGKIGAGGMGTVFQAEQENPRRTVALKVANADLFSPSVMKRFEYEAQVLGRLQHPGIAQIFEAGSATNDLGQEQPYFAMEFIDGLTLNEFADEHRLSARQRIRLFVDVCDAVQHAHLRGFIHRDLKPANILVDLSGQPKVLDFGIARATDSDVQLTTMQTSVGELIGTVPYMSPEQIAGDPRELDARSDVYALGVVLYELLAGRLPYDFSGKMIHDAVRVVREVEPTPISTTVRTLRGDIETIVQKALEKEPARRYQSAAELAADLKRHLSDEPILARPPSALYQLRKFTRRNKALVCGTAFVILSLVLGVAGTTWQAIVATRAHELSEQRLDAAETVTNFLRDMLASTDPRRSGRDVKVIDLLARAAAEVENSFTDQPTTAAALHDSLGVAYTGLGLYDQAEQQLQRALELRRSAGPAQLAGAAESQHNLGVVLLKKSDYGRARGAIAAALQQRRSLFGEHHALVAASLDSLGQLLRHEGDLTASESALRQAWTLREELLGGDDPTTIESMSHLGRMLQYKGDFERAEKLLRDALLRAERRCGTRKHYDVSTAMTHLAELLRDVGKYDEAENLLREVVEVSGEIVGETHPDVGWNLHALGELLIERGKGKEASPLFDRALMIYKQAYGETHKDVAKTINAIAYTTLHRDEPDAAERLFREALAINERVFGDKHAEVAACFDNIAICLQWKWQHDEAERYHLLALNMLRELGETSSPQIATCLFNLGTFYQRKGDLTRAEPLLREARDVETLRRGKEHLYVAEVENSLGLAIYRDPAKLDEAVTLFRHAVEVFKRLSDPRWPEPTRALARALREQKHLNEAEPLFREALAAQRRRFPADDYRISSMEMDLGLCLTAMGRSDEGEQLLVGAFPPLKDNARFADARRCLDALIKIYESRGQSAELGRYRRESEILDAEEKRRHREHEAKEGETTTANNEQP